MKKYVLLLLLAYVSVLVSDDSSNPLFVLSCREDELIHKCEMRYAIAWSLLAVLIGGIFCIITWLGCAYPESEDEPYADSCYEAGLGQVEKPSLRIVHGFIVGMLLWLWLVVIKYASFHYGLYFCLGAAVLLATGLISDGLKMSEESFAKIGVIEPAKGFRVASHFVLFAFGTGSICFLELLKRGEVSWYGFLVCIAVLIIVVVTYEIEKKNWTFTISHW